MPRSLLAHAALTDAHSSFSLSLTRTNAFYLRHTHRIRQYYGEYAPDNVGKAREASHRFSGDRGTLNEALKGKYGVSLDEFLLTLL